MASLAAPLDPLTTLSPQIFGKGVQTILRGITINEIKSKMAQRECAARVRLMEFWCKNVKLVLVNRPGRWKRVKLMAYPRNR